MYERPLERNVRLVAMPASGEVAFVRDSRDKLWLYRSSRAGGVEPVGEQILARALAGGDFALVDLRFDNWASLDRARLAKAAEFSASTPAFDVLGFDRDDIERELRVAERRLARGKHDSVDRRLKHLLRAPVLSADEGLRLRTIELLERAVPSGPVWVDSAPDKRHAIARERAKIPVPA